VTARRSAGERRAEFEERGLMWHRCTMEIERVRLQLRAAGTDPAGIAPAAQAGAAILSAWSVAVEGDHPAAISGAARQLARSAELREHTPSTPRGSSRASGLAMFLLVAGEPASQMGWLLVARQVALLAREVGRVHAARGELERAPANREGTARRARRDLLAAAGSAAGRRPAVGPGRRVRAAHAGTARDLNPAPRRNVHRRPPRPRRDPLVVAEICAASLVTKTQTLWEPSGARRLE
jgi:hypothetical protein